MYEWLRSIITGSFAHDHLLLPPPLMMMTGGSKLPPLLLLSSVGQWPFRSLWLEIDGWNQVHMTQQSSAGLKPPLPQSNLAG